MADELQVVVQQEVGVINWNFEQLKNALEKKMNEYQGMVYTENTVPAAKSDIATLRKLKKSVSDKRIEIKNKCLEPYEIIESQAKELIELIDRPIENISSQLDAYETKRREKIKNEIVEYMTKSFSNLPNDVAKKLQFKIYDAKWENVTTTKKTWKQAIDDAEKFTSNDLSLINNLEDEFKESALREYANNLSLADTMTRVEEMRKQKAIILQRERERIAAEERAKIEAERHQNEEMRPKTQETGQSRVLDVEAIKTMPATSKRQETSNTDELTGTYEIRTFKIRATASQFAKIKGYIEYCGAKYREEA